MVLSYLASAPRRLGRALIKVYRHGFSALSGFDCRHLPTCSDYGDEAIGRFGLWAGGWMTLARLCRCQIARVGICPGATGAGAGPPKSSNMRLQSKRLALRYLRRARRVAQLIYIV